MEIRTINKRKFTLIKEMGLGDFIELSQLMQELGEDELKLPMIQRFIGNAEKLKRFVCLALEPVEPCGEKYKKWDDLKHITLPTLIEVLGDFFASGGPLKLAFPDALMMTPPSTQTPMKDSAN